MTTASVLTRLVALSLQWNPSWLDMNMKCAYSAPLTYANDPLVYPTTTSLDILDHAVSNTENADTRDTLRLKQIYGLCHSRGLGDHVTCRWNSHPLLSDCFLSPVNRHMHCRDCGNRLIHLN